MNQSAQQVQAIGDYVIVDVLRSGNHGTVYLAEPPARLDSELDHVALKTLKQHADNDDFRRVANEARLLHSVNSPHVLPLLDAGTVDGQLFFVTPTVDGTLERAHETHHAAQICRWIADAALGVHELHQLGVAHRDIRPENILHTNGRGVIGELDLAQLLGGGSTMIGGPLGTLEFTAPEIILGNAASRRTDIWSLAMTVHRALTGESAIGEIPDTSLIEACRHLIHTRPTISEALPATVQSVVERSLAEEPTDRFATAADFAAALMNVTNGASQ